MSNKKSVATNDDKNKAFETMSKKEMLVHIAQLTEKCTMQETKLATAKIVKLTSEYFCNSKNEFITYKNLSETKRHFENEHAQLLKSECELLSVPALTSKAFHTLLDSKVRA